jgi:hypothetical protein
MVEMARVALERKLGSIASVLSNTAKKTPMLGLVQGGQFRIYQDGDMPIWNVGDIETDENFVFSASISKLKEIIGGFKTSSVNLVSDGKGSIIVKSGRSQVKIPYVEGIYDDIPDSPTIGLNCTTDSSFLGFLESSKDFVSRTFDQVSLTYSYIGSTDDELIISGMNGFCLFTASVPYKGVKLPDLVIPVEFTEAVARLLAGSETINIGLSENGKHVVMSDESMTLYSPRIQQTYPDMVHKLRQSVGTKLCEMDKKETLDQLRLALQTTEQDLIGIASTLEGSGLQLSVPRSNIEAELMIEDVTIIQPFECVYFQLPFLIQCINTFPPGRINMERLPDFNDAIRISNDTSTAAATLRPYLSPES